ncbi:MAG: hypothetical protein LBR80_09605, partial [Deltaproteobacteria bacterium]|nr:hypothetical protein [Deltaproteobacteria bacterium]
VKARLKPRNEVSASAIQNTSDPDAGYCRHKGRGYKVTVAGNVVIEDADGNRDGLSIISFVGVATANTHDGHAILDTFKAWDLENEL